MHKIDILIPAGINVKKIPILVEQVCARKKLDLALKGTLAKYPGCIHWHYRHGRQRGTLEITWWARERRLWFKVASRRSAAWIDQVLPRLKERIENH